MKPTKSFFFCILFFATLFTKAQTVLWATATSGGANNQGTILQADSTGTNFHAVYSFVDSTGTYPVGNLVKANNGKLYGVAQKGGLQDTGVIFNYDPSTGIYSKIYDYSSNPQFGIAPQSGLISGYNGKLYGLCSDGGPNWFGVINSVDPSTNTYSDIFDFNFFDGYLASGGLLQINSLLFGMTNSGGANAVGVIFSFNPVNNNYQIMHDFDFTNGGWPLYGSLVQATNGKLYGMTEEGGLNYWGVIFCYDWANNIYTNLHDFDLASGANPKGSLIQATNGKLYGLTNFGGTHNHGVLFSFDITTNSYTVLHNFNVNGGISPTRSLIQTSSGKLLGTTSWGGAHNKGVIFSFNIANNNYTKLFDFDSINGSNPDCDILETPAIPTALQTLSSNQTFSIYPNPAVNFISITGSSSPLEFVDVYGRIIKTFYPENKTNTTIDVSAFPNVFFVRDANGVVKKVIRKG